MCIECDDKGYSIRNDHKGKDVIQRCDECNNQSSDIWEWLNLCPHQNDVDDRDELFEEVSKIITKHL